MSSINFEARLFKINSSTILLLPKDASAKLPSRGMVMVEGSLNGFEFQSPLEPDGRGSHWLKINKKMLNEFHIKIGETVKLSIEPMKVWPEPEIPKDLNDALKDDPKAYDIWKIATPNAHWDWIRWISATNNPATRKHRIEVERDKLRKGMRRPCCFNRSMCCDFTVCKNGVLLTND